LAGIHLDIDTFEVHGDIRTFLRTRFSAIRREKSRFMRGAPTEWPSRIEMEKLVEKCSGSFAFAHTLVKFVNDGRDLPHRKLQIALDMHDGLDPLYMQVLLAAPRGQYFERILSTIMLLAEPLPITELARLLQIEVDIIPLTLLGIQSILIVPKNNNEPVRLYHTSLRDFLTSRNRSGDQFFIDPPSHHSYIVIDCLRLMVIQSEQFFFEKDAGRYASLMWCKHFILALKEGEAEVSLDSSLVASLTEFMSRSLRTWVNTCISDDNTEGALDDLKSLLFALEVGHIVLRLHA